MSDGNSTNIPDALRKLRQVLEDQLERESNAALEALSRHQYEQIDEALNEVRGCMVSLKKMDALEQEWVASSTTNGRQLGAQIPNSPRAVRRHMGRLRRGQRTPEHAFRKPILESLVEMGGSGRVGDVLARVEERMQGILNEADFGHRASDNKNPRWHNTANWARNSMVRDGLLKANSSRGIWEISGKGGEWLETQREAVKGGTNSEDASIGEKEQDSRAQCTPNANANAKGHTSQTLGLASCSTANMIRFQFMVNKSFLENVNHPITVPKAFYNRLRDGFARIKGPHASMPIGLVGLNGIRSKGGYIYHGSTGDYRYYQIRILAFDSTGYCGCAKNGDLIDVAIEKANTEVYIRLTPHLDSRRSS